MRLISTNTASLNEDDRIIFLTHSWHPDESPPQRRTQMFVQQWISSDRSATVIASAVKSTHRIVKTPHRAQKPIQNGELSIRLSWTEPAGNTLIKRMAQQLRQAVGLFRSGISTSFAPEYRPSCIVATVPSLPTAFVGWLLSKIHRVPLVIDVRDAWPDLIQYTRQWESPYHRSVSNIFCNQLAIFIAKIGVTAFTQVLEDASHVITTSDNFRRQLNLRGITSVTTIMNPYGGIGGNPEPSNRSRRIVSVSSGRPLKLLYAGTVGRAQGLSTSIEALSIAVQRGANIQLRIVGNGAEVEMLRRLASDLNMKVEFIERVSRDEMPAHYAWCDACIVQLRDWKPLEYTVPSKLVEIMAMGIPVCLSANGESGEIVRKTESGTVVPAMDSAALANLWLEWAETGPPELNADATWNWLQENASTDVAGKKFRALIAKLKTNG